MIPISEAQSVVSWCASQVNDKRKNQQANDRNDLDGCENEFGLSVDRNRENIQAEDNHPDDGDPSSCSDLSVPEPDDNGSGGDLSAESQRIGVPVVPANSKAHSVIDIASAVLRHRTGER